MAIKPLIECSKTLQEWAESCREYPDLMRMTWPTPARIAAGVWQDERDADEPLSSESEIDIHLSEALRDGDRRWAAKAEREA